MIAGRNSEDYYPITWVGQVPVYVTTILVAVHVLCMVGVTLALSLSGVPIPEMSPWLTPLLYSSSDILHQYKVWQFVTYAFVNAPSLWFVIDMWLLYAFGREVEKFLGRRAFILLYASLLLVAPVVLTLLSILNFPASIFPAVLGGSGALHFAIFVAFVVLYPSAEMMFLRIQAKWIAVILLAIYSLQYLAQHEWVPLGVLWLESACAVLMLRASGVTNASFESWLPARDYDSEPKAARKPKREAKEEVNPHDLINPLLEKISQHGIASLTKRERQQLEQARAALLEKEKHSHR